MPNDQVVSVIVTLQDPEVVFYKQLEALHKSIRKHHLADAVMPLFGKIKNNVEFLHEHMHQYNELKEHLEKRSNIARSISKTIDEICLAAEQNKREGIPEKVEGLSAELSQISQADLNIRLLMAHKRMISKLLEEFEGCKSRFFSVVQGKASKAHRDFFFSIARRAHELLECHVKQCQDIGGAKEAYQQLMQCLDDVMGVDEYSNVSPVNANGAQNQIFPEEVLIKSAKDTRPGFWKTDNTETNKLRASIDKKEPDTDAANSCCSLM